MRNLPPKGGWKPNTIYLVEVKITKDNVEHKAILHTGFINNGAFGNYCEVWCNTYNKSISAEDVYSITFVKTLGKLET